MRGSLVVWRLYYIQHSFEKKTSLLRSLHADHAIIIQMLYTHLSCRSST